MRASRERTGSARLGRPALAPILGLAGLLAGCGTSGIQVEREAHLPADSAGATFMMLAARGQDTDPGHARNADLVAAELVARHFVRVSDPAAAHFAVMVWDRRGESRAAEGRSGSSPASGLQGRGRGGMGMPGGSGRMRGGPPPADAPDPAPRPVRRVEIQIYDLTRPQGAGEHVFTADARVAESEVGERGAAELIAAALRDFPGRERERFSVPLRR